MPRPSPTIPISDRFFERLFVLNALNFNGPSTVQTSAFAATATAALATRDRDTSAKWLANPLQCDERFLDSCE